MESLTVSTRVPRIEARLIEESARKREVTVCQFVRAVVLERVLRDLDEDPSSWLDVLHDEPTRRRRTARKAK